VKKRLALVIAVLATVAFVGVGLAQTGPAEKPAQPAPQKTAKVKTKTLTGFVVAFDQEAQTLTVKEESKKHAQHTFALEEKAATQLAGLKAGDKIRVGYTKAEGKSIASSIKVLKKAKAS
jgi:Cu/Ag efflux protein CusF